MWAPNIWVATAEVYDATVRLDMPEPATLGPAVHRLDAVLPTRQRLFGGFASADMAAAHPGGTDRPRLLGQIALALQTLARAPDTTFLQVTPAGEPGLFRIVLQSHDPLLAEACLREAGQVLDHALRADLPDLVPLIDRLTDLADDVCVGPGTMLIVRAAAARGIPWRRMGGDSLVQFGQGVRQHRIWTAVTDRTSAIAEGIAMNKQLTKD
ncbi:MAG: hypothetical protein ACKOK8_09020, partial [Planctomycetia bacterium]